VGGTLRYVSTAFSTAARLVSAISCPCDSAVVNAFKVLGVPGDIDGQT
jgi:hypothetical protein